MKAQAFSLIKLLPLLCLIGLPLASHAAGSRVTTFDGSDGLKTQFFDVHCSACHPGLGPDWSDYATTNTYSASIDNRINLPEADPLFMPQSGSTVDDSLFQAWLGDGKPRYQSPYINNSVISGSSSRIGTNNYSLSVSFTVNENGSSTTFTAYYRKGADSWSSVSSSNPSGTGGSGDSGSDGSSSATLTNLECGNVYSVYLYGNNAATGSTSSSTDTLSSITCNQGMDISGSPSNATEDSLSQWTPSKNDLDGAGSSTATRDNLTYSFSSGPTVTGGNTSNTPTINSSTGEVSWEPTEGNTQASFSILVTDSWADTNIDDTLAVIWNVDAIIDEDPVITTSSIPDGTEDTTSYSIQFTASDADTVDTETWTITAESDPQMSITTGGLFTWSPLEGEAGAHSVTIQVEDSGGRTDSQVYNFTINPDYTAPVITTAPATPETVNEDSQIVIDFDASDVDSPFTHTWSITSPVLPFDGMAIDSNTGEFTWTPSSDADLLQSVTVRVTDDGTLYDVLSFNIDVTAIADNDPVITTVSMPGATEYNPYSQTLSFTDADTDGDSWTWAISAGPTPATANPLAIDPSTGEVTWEPANNESSVTFSARVTDSRGDPHYDEQELTINVSAVNDPPVIDGTPIATQEVDEDALLTLDIDATDPDAGDTQTWSIISPASPPDDMSIDNNGVFTWTPSSEVSLSQNVTVRIADSGNLQDETTFTVNVTPVIDHPPEITSVQGDIPQATEDTAFSHTLSWTDADLEGDGWTWSLTALDDPDIAINPSTGEIIWTPQEGERDNFNITARVTDDGGLFDEITLVINVQKDNEAPVISGTPIAPQAATEDLPFSLDIDKTDGDIGDTESWQITTPASLPDDMAIDNNGMLTWTPGEGIDRIQNVTVEITDEGGLSDSTSFAINVTSVNDAPVIDAVIPDASVEEHSSFTYTLSVSDSDPQDNDPDLLSNLSFTITGITPSPNSAGPSIDSNGQINWTPGDNDARSVDSAALSQDYVISVAVADEGEDSQGPATQDFTLTVTLLDNDLDTVPDYEDNCVATDNTDQANNDDDSLGDLCDPDDDNDGISDIAELFNGLKPFDANDALLDLDNDGLNNLEEFNICTDSDIESLLECGNIQIDSVAPIITHSGHVDIVAAGYTTFVDYSATASDGIDGPVSVSADFSEKNLRPGGYVITWTAQDVANNIATEEQHITIHPLLSMGGAQVLAEGASGFATLLFNGDLPLEDFPVSISYTTEGSSSLTDYIITPASPLLINNPGELVNNEFMLTIDALDDGFGEGTENLIIKLNSLSSGPELGVNTKHEVLIAEGQVAPTSNLQAVQNAIETSTIYGDQGTVTVNANALDGNGDSLSYDWSNSDAALSGSALGDQFSFDPATLALETLPKVFTVAVTVSDGIDSIEQKLALIYLADELNLTSTDSDGDGIDDDVEGAGDSDQDGIPDYLDTYDNPPTLLFSGNQNGSNLAPEFLETEAGFQLSLGNYGLANGEFAPGLNSTELANLGENINDEGYIHFGTIYDFIITGFTLNTTSALLVIPIQQNMPPNTEIRLYDGNTWFSFTENSNNSLSSASSGENSCPQIGNSDYQSGLNAFRDCILISISDGGPNDTDGLVNGSIRITAGLAVPEDADIFEPEETIDESDKFKSDGPAGTGRLTLLMTLLMVLLAGSRLFSRNNHPGNKTTR